MTFTIQVMFGDGRPPLEETYTNWTKAYRKAKALVLYHGSDNGVFLFSPDGSVIEVQVNGFRKVAL